MLNEMSKEMLQVMFMVISLVLLVVALVIHGTATKLETARNITLNGAVTGSTTFDGSKNVQINTNIPVTKQVITKEDDDVKMVITARKSANIVSLHFAMTYKTTDILMQFTDTIPSEFRPKENIKLTATDSQLTIGTTGAVSGNYVENLGTNFVITYIVD